MKIVYDLCESFLLLGLLGVNLFFVRFLFPDLYEFCDDGGRQKLGDDEFILIFI